MFFNSSANKTPTAFSH